MQIETLAQQVVLIVKNALAPITDRVSALEGRFSQVTVSSETIATLRERLAVAEAKAAQLQPVDLSQVNERILDQAKGLSAMVDQALLRVYDRIAAIELAVKSVPQPDITHVDAAIADIAKDVLGLRERMAAAEARAPIPGPPGPVGEKGADGRDGLNGKDGRDGKDGQDGTLDGLEMEQPDERTMRFKHANGTPVRGGVWYAPAALYRDVWQEKQYERGDLVTWAGAMWHCNEETTAKPGDGSRAWTLCVKKGRDGRDGKDAPSALPVVSIGGRGGSQ